MQNVHTLLYSLITDSNSFLSCKVFPTLLTAWEEIIFTLLKPTLFYDLVTQKFSETHGFERFDRTALN